MPHESDGVIIQPWRAPYLAGTDGQVLKWKFPHLNSVDFKFTIPKKVRNVNAAPEALVRSAIVELVDSAAQLDWDAVDQGKEERAEEVGSAAGHKNHLIFSYYGGWFMVMVMIMVVSSNSRKYNIFPYIFF